MKIVTLYHFEMIPISQRNVIDEFVSIPYILVMNGILSLGFIGGGIFLIFLGSSRDEINVFIIGIGVMFLIFSLVTVCYEIIILKRFLRIKKNLLLLPSTT